MIISLRKGQRFTCVTSQPLSQRVIPSLLVSRLAGFFTHQLMGLFREHIGIGFPEIAERLALLIAFRGQLPQLAAGLLTAITDDKSDNLAGTTTQSRSQPSLFALFAHKRPCFIDFQHVIRSCGHHCCGNWGNSVIQCSNQRVTVCRPT
jgi:hypothetical protein